MSKSARLILIIGAILFVLVLCGACSALLVAFFRAGERPTAVTSQPLTSSATRSAATGDTLRVFGGEPVTLDPAMVQDSTSAQYVVHLFSGLVTLDRKLEVVPDLATRWDVSSDGLIYTFELRPDATFGDGTPITAEDFVYSIERACSPELGSPVAPVYLGDIVGAAEYNAGLADHIAGLEAVEPHRLRVTIDAPKAYFLAKLTYSTAFVVDRRQIEREGAAWERHPNGSGPFALDTLTGDEIVLVRNDRYYGSAPLLARVEFVLSGGMPMTMYESDQLDIVGVSAYDIERVQDPDNPLNAELVVAPELSVEYLGLNVNLPPFDDLAVRQAFACAIDRDKLANLVLKGPAFPAVGILPPSLPDHNVDLAGLPFDPDRARALLAGSRYGGPENLPEIVLTIDGTSGYMSSMAEAVLGMVEENLGIEMRVEQVEWPYFLRDLNAQRYQMFSSGWIADYPDSQDFLDILFHSASSQNHTGYRNPAVDALLERARVAPEAERTALYRQAEELIVNDATWIPLTHGSTATLVKPYVQGFPASANMYPWLKEIAFVR
ncbi:MAG: peptide ABC transporter substrate-binding protein [Chloroflexi bacterium]|nr:peptide ABC transporter substrate-binding protein [Chloroflexota bacterium]